MILLVVSFKVKYILYNSQKNTNVIFLTTLLLSLSLIFSACTTKKTPSINSLKSIQLKIEKMSLNIDENTTLRVDAIYNDGSTKEITEEVEWIISQMDTVTINKNKLKTLKDKNIILKAKLNNVISNPISLEIYLEINGYRLPPEPDKTLNDSTLLGIDVNNNDVRDDVERWIYKKYEEKHPVHMDILMQAARGYKKVLETPEKAREIHNEVDSGMYCSWYYRSNAQYFNQPINIDDNIISRKIEKIYFNNDERYDTHRYYGSFLSGGVYSLPKRDKRKEFCDFNVSKYRE